MIVGQSASAPAAATMRPSRIAQISLVAEFLAPRPEPPCRVVQRIFLGEAHRAMHLVGDGGAGGGCFADAQFGDRRSRPAWSSRTMPAWAIASAAASAAAPAAATSPARAARLCCTAWNFAIGRPNCTRSSEYCTDWSRMCSRAPAICCARAAAPSRTRAAGSSPGAGADRLGGGIVERHRVLRLAGEADPGADRRARSPSTRATTG